MLIWGPVNVSGRNESVWNDSLRPTLTSYFRLAAQLSLLSFLTPRRVESETASVVPLVVKKQTHSVCVQSTNFIPPTYLTSHKNTRVCASARNVREERAGCEYTYLRAMIIQNIWVQRSGC